MTINLLPQIAGLEPNDRFKVEQMFLNREIRVIGINRSLKSICNQVNIF
jgi:hypothetical protein